MARKADNVEGLRDEGNKENELVNRVRRARAPPPMPSREEGDETSRLGGGGNLFRILGLSGAGGRQRLQLATWHAIDGGQLASDSREY